MCPMQVEKELDKWLERASRKDAPHINGMRMERPTWDEYFSFMVKLVARRSTCLFHHDGAILVRNNRVLTTGYVGSPKGIEHCTDVGCTDPEWSGVGWPSNCRGLHSIQNAIIQGAIFGIEVKGATLYTSEFPCLTCTKMLLNSGIIRVNIISTREENKVDDDVVDLLKKGGVELRFRDDLEIREGLEYDREE